MPYLPQLATFRPFSEVPFSAPYIPSVTRLENLDNWLFWLPVEQHRFLLSFYFCKCFFPSLLGYFFPPSMALRTGTMDLIRTYVLTWKELYFVSLMIRSVLRVRVMKWTLLTLFCFDQLPLWYTLRRLLSMTLHYPLQTVSVFGITTGFFFLW